MLSIVFTLTGTFFIPGEIVIHWNSSGEPDGSAGTWILWALLLDVYKRQFQYGVVLVVMALLSLFLGMMSGFSCAEASCGLAKNLQMCIRDRHKPAHKGRV